MRCGNSGEGSHLLFHMKVGNQIAGIQASFGVGDNIYLVTMFYSKDFFDFVLNESGIFFYSSPGLLMPVIDNGPIAGQFFRNPPPIIEIA